MESSNILDSCPSHTMLKLKLRVNEYGQCEQQQPPQQLLQEQNQHWCFNNTNIEDNTINNKASKKKKKRQRKTKNKDNNNNVGNWCQNFVFPNWEHLASCAQHFCLNFRTTGCLEGKCSVCCSALIMGMKSMVL